MSFWSTFSPAQRTAAGVCLHLFIIAVGCHLAFAGLSAKSTLGVFCGMGLLAALGTGYANKILTAVRWAKDHMRSILPLLLLVLCVGGCTRVEPGHVGILVHLYGGAKGVDFEPVGVGMVWYNPMWTSVYEYPTFVQTAVWSASTTEGKELNEEISFTCEGMVITGDISLSYHLEADKVPAFFAKFRSDRLDTFTHGFLHNVARDAFNETTAAGYTVEQCYGSKRDEILTMVRGRIMEAVSAYGVVLEQFGYLGHLRLPEKVVAALNAKIQATQDAIRVENEIRQATAEAAKTVATAEGAAKSATLRAQADAANNRLIAESLTPALVQYMLVQRWNGQRPMVEGTGSSLFLQLPAPSAPAAKVVP